jgi:P-type Ca2+ transporter type 2C
MVAIAGPTVCSDGSGIPGGLSAAEAARRLRDDGPNVIPSGQNRSLWGVAWEVVREPMFLMLVAAGTLYLSMGDLADALMLLAFVVFVMGITVIQERRTERALDALRDLSSPRALVLRDGMRKRIASREVVRGDIVFVAEGDRVPADGVLRQAQNLAADESLLTGESVPVRKRSASGQDTLDRPGGDDLPSIFSGSLITSGQGVAEVVATGAGTGLGRIGKQIQSLETGSTPLQRETAGLVRTLAIVGLAASALVVVLYGLTRGGSSSVWKDGFLAGIAMAMATLPEELPVVLTVFLALGAWRISRSRVLTRRMPAVETLGSATVLCVDKTGTLTVNQMSLVAVDAGNGLFDARTQAAATPEVERLLDTATLASRSDPFDPMERALQVAARRFVPNRSARSNVESIPVSEYPLTSQRLAVTQAWRLQVRPGFRVATKGAPEAVADLCRLSPPERSDLSSRVADLAVRGWRVLGVAEAPWNAEQPPGDPREATFRFVGLLAFEDPLREAVPAAVRECHAAGVRVVMITGDYPATAAAIARRAGLPNPESILTGPDLDAMTDEQLAGAIARVTIFARVVPEQKLRIVEALKARGDVVAMTGDGVNDAPALKAAHIGIAMGGRGSDVAREAASLVLLDDDFSSIVAAIRLGRRIFDNIRKAIAYVFAVHVPIAGLSMIPVFHPDWPLLLLPVHIVFLELIIDPACSLVFEAEEAEPDVMRRPPRNPRERLFSFGAVTTSLLQGFGTLVAAFGVYLEATALGQPTDGARGAAFITLVLADRLLVFTNRSWTQSTAAMMRVPNLANRWVTRFAIVFLVVVLTVPSLQRLFHFARPSVEVVVLSLLASVACGVWFEVMKRVYRAGRRTRSDGGAIPGCVALPGGETGGGASMGITSAP